MSLEVNQATLDYLQVKLAGEIKSKVEGDIFRFYRNWLSVVGGVLAAVGVAVGWPALSGYIQQAAEKAATARVESALEQHKALMDRATKEAEGARELATAIKGLVDLRKDEFAQHTNRALARFDDFRDVIERNEQAIDRLRKASSAVDEDFKKFRVTFEQLAGREGTLVTLRDIDPLTASIDKLVERVVAMEAALSTLPAPPALPRPSKAPNSFKELGLGDLEVKAMAVQRRIDTVKAEPKGLTVYLQFAGAITRDEIRSLSKDLVQQNWIVPGEERRGEAAGKREIRCFHEDDCRAAEVLRTDLESALAHGQFVSEGIEVKRLLSYSPKPRAGILEVWIEPKKR